MQKACGNHAHGMRTHVHAGVNVSFANSGPVKPAREATMRVLDPGHMTKTERLHLSYGVDALRL